MGKIRNNTLVFLAVLALAITTSAYFYIKANEESQTLISKNTVYYTPGKQHNCKWIFNVSQHLLDTTGSSSKIQIGIPEATALGYIEGLLEVSVNSTLILAFNLPQASVQTPPLLFTSTYDPLELPLNKLKFRMFNSTIIVMNLYNSYEKCIETTIK